MMCSRADCGRQAITESDDVLKGGSGDDVLKEVSGDDVLHGGSGDDVLRVNRR